MKIQNNQSSAIQLQINTPQVFLFFFLFFFNQNVHPKLCVLHCGQPFCPYDWPRVGVQSASTSITLKSNQPLIMLKYLIMRKLKYDLRDERGRVWMKGL